MARFSRKRMYYRLIGRLSVLEIIIVYLPAIIINLTSINQIMRGDHLFWLNIDSLFLVTYAIVLIIVVLTQREKLISSTLLFKFSELFRLDSEEEAELEAEDDDTPDRRYTSEKRPPSETDEGEKSK